MSLSCRDDKLADKARIRTSRNRQTGLKSYQLDKIFDKYVYKEKFQLLFFFFF